MPTWDPDLYRQFADDRDRPFWDLIARVPLESTEGISVVDLGCGEGSLTLGLAQRWPGARIVGVDSSPAMIEAATRPARHGRAPSAGALVTFDLQTIQDWMTGTAPASVDVIVSNAALQWIPGHIDLLPDLLTRLRPGGWLAVQVPANYDSPSHTILRELAAAQPYAAHTSGSVRAPDSPTPGEYIDVLASAGANRLDVWSTSYQHVLPGEDPVFAWISGTGARPILQSLPEDLRAQFEENYRVRLRSAFPAQRYGTVLPFLRNFVLARRGE